MVSLYETMPLFKYFYDEDYKRRTTFLSGVRTTFVYHKNERDSRLGIALDVYIRVLLITLQLRPVRRLTNTDYQHIMGNLGNIWETL